MGNGLLITVYSVNEGGFLILENPEPGAACSENPGYGLASCVRCMEAVFYSNSLHGAYTQTHTQPETV